MGVNWLFRNICYRQLYCVVCVLTYLEFFNNFLIKTIRTHGREKSALCVRQRSPWRHTHNTHTEGHVRPVVTTLGLTMIHLPGARCGPHRGARYITNSGWNRGWNSRAPPTSSVALALQADLPSFPYLFVWPDNGYFSHTHDEKTCITWTHTCHSRNNHAMCVRASAGLAITYNVDGTNPLVPVRRAYIYDYYLTITIFFFFP